MERLLGLVPLYMKSVPFWTSMVLLYITLVIVKNWLATKDKDLEDKNGQQKPNKHQEQQQQKPKKKHPQFEGKWTQNKQKFSHDWLLNSLKGHGGSILDMDFSPNGKYLATCGDDDGGGVSGSSSGSEGNKENSSPSQSGKQLSRRQKKNNKIRNNSPAKKKKQKNNTVLRQLGKLNMNEIELFNFMQNYMLNYEHLYLHGYPVECKIYPGRAIIHNSFNKHPSEDCVYPSLLVKEAGTYYSKSSVPSSVDCGISLEKKCARCMRSFFMLADGEYLTQEVCVYHWGRLQRMSNGCLSIYTCCKSKEGTIGCTTGKLHVWKGIQDGLNGPYGGYVRTKPRKTPPTDGNYKIYALDCEMCYTTSGMELTKISVVTHDGRLIYNTYVKPDSFVIDYNTRFSGVTAKDITKKSKVLKDVQNDLMGFINAETILVGHSLENDLRALKMMHTSIVDTSVIFPHFYGLPYKRSLKSLMHSILKRDIQTDTSGHDPTEDARACLELIFWKMRKDKMNNDLKTH